MGVNPKARLDNCPGMKRDGRCGPGAWSCRHCKHWHYLKRNPVRRGTLRVNNWGGSPSAVRFPVEAPVGRVISYPCLAHLVREQSEQSEDRVRGYPGLRDGHLRDAVTGTRAALRQGMPKSRRRRHEADHAAVDIVSQLECAIRRPQATLIGALVGGLIPWFARTLAHEEIPSTWSAGSHALALAMIAVVLGCACFSGLSVYKFGRATFGDARKAIGFTIALEGVMLVSHGATSAVALLVLVLINALGNGATIALARDATCRRREADARRAATRRSSRGAAQVPRVSPAMQTRATGTPGMVKVPRWTAPVDASDTVIDAEIVSEEMFS